MTLNNNPRNNNIKAVRRNMKVLALAAFSALLAACSSVDCPLNNLVYTTYALKTADGNPDTLRLLMTVSTNRTDGSDSVLINRDSLVNSFSLPISNANPRDTFFVELTSNGSSTLDTLIVGKTDQMHFESTDCTPSYFHNINEVTTTHNAIDSVAIHNPTVNYDTTIPQFYIYFAPRQ